MKSKELSPVKYEHLKHVLTSHDFLQGIRKATRIGLNMHTESHFTFWRSAFYNQVKCFSPDRITSDLPFSTSFEFSENDYDMIRDEQLMPLVFYHCHPFPRVRPSEADLVGHCDVRAQENILDKGPSIYRVENYHIDCIGAIREGGRYHDVLVLQNRSKQGDRSDGECAYQHIRETLGERCSDNGAVAEALNDSDQWNAVLLTYEKRGKGYYACEEELFGLERFTYTPIMTEENHLEEFDITGG